MEHSKEKDFYEFFIKNILQYYKIIDNNLLKSEKPDFKNNKVGLEITRVDPSLEFDGFIAKSKNGNLMTVKKYNNVYERLGGKVLKKTDTIVKILDLNNNSNKHKDYVYIPPCYNDSFELINKKVEDKLNKLNNIYDKKITNYFLGIFSPIFANENMINEELKQLKKIEYTYNKKFDKVIIVFLEKLCEFDLINYKYNIINFKVNELNKISIETEKELNTKENQY